MKNAQPGTKEMNATTSDRITKTTGIMNNPCGAPACVANSIDPEDFLSECIAPVCWDCWFVSRKIELQHK